MSTRAKEVNKSKSRWLGSVKAKIVSMVVVAALVPMIVSILVTKNGTADLSKTINHHLQDGVDRQVQVLNDTVVELVQMANENLLHQIEYGIKAAERLAKEKGGIGFSNETVSWTAVNQFSKEAKEVRLPKMLVGGQWFGQVKDSGTVVPLVDDVQQSMGGVVTVFQRINAQGDMLRVATNVKTKNGDRAMGTYIPATEPDGKQNPVIQSVLSGKTFTGRAFVVDAWYTTAYSPVRGAGGQVVGMLFYGLDQDKNQGIRKSIMAKKIGDGGYVAILGGTGNMKGRYIISLNGKRDGEDIIGAQDTKGRLIIKEMVEKAVTLEEGKSFIYRYDWKNAADPAPREKIAAIGYFKPWDWVVLSTAYVDELNDSAKIIREKTRRVEFLSALFGLLGTALVVGFVLIFVTKLTNPLKRLVAAAHAISLGDVQQNVEDSSNDEVGQLADAFRNMIGYLKSLAVSARSLGEGDVSAVVTPKSERDELSKNLAFALGQVSGLINELKKVNSAVNVGNLSVRGEAEKFQGGYGEIISGVNSTLDSVMKPVLDATRVLERVAHKDMTARVTGAFFGDHAKIKEAVNLAAETLDQSLQQVAVGAGQIASASGQIGTGAQSLAQGTSEQASSLEKVASSLQEMTAMTRQNSANAKEARGIAEATKTSAENGVGSMQRLSAAMDLIKKSSDDTAKIIKTIDEIAFQTNLLALNAAVEAARAGEAGKGFAVVAEEVRNLAMRSAEAAKNTANMIEGSVKNSENGVAINHEVMKNLEEINGHAKRVSEVMAEIAAASDQQSQGVGQVNTAMEQMNQLTQQNAANSEESASASEELSAQAQEMRAMVAGFKISGGSPSAPPSKGTQARNLTADSVRGTALEKGIGGGNKTCTEESTSRGRETLNSF
jgi:methyl-accepting chemotaxis protein